MVTRREFEALMRRADFYRKMQTEDPETSGYWTGYVRGLRRAFHGEAFGTEDEHLRWYEDRGERGRGYRAGLREGEQ